MDVVIHVWYRNFLIYKVKIQKKKLAYFEYCEQCMHTVLIGSFSFTKAIKNRMCKREYAS